MSFSTSVAPRARCCLHPLGIGPQHRAAVPANGRRGVVPLRASDSLSMTSSRDTARPDRGHAEQPVQDAPVHDRVELVGLALQMQRLSAQIFLVNVSASSGAMISSNFIRCLQTAGAGVELVRHDETRSTGRRRHQARRGPARIAAAARPPPGHPTTVTLIAVSKLQPESSDRGGAGGGATGRSAKTTCRRRKRRWPALRRAAGPASSCT